MLSVETSEVSSEPGRDVWNSWKKKLSVLVVALPVEDAVDPEVLRADVRAEVRPARVLGIGGRMDGIRADVAEPARHADAVRLDEIAATSSSSGRGSSARRPTSCARPRRSPGSGTGATRRCRWARRSTSRPAPSCRARRSRCPGTSSAFGERIRRAGGIAHVEPQAVAVGIGAGGLPEARLVDEPEVLEPVVAVVPLRIRHRRVRRQRLEEVERAEAGRPRSRPRSDRCRRSTRSTCCGPSPLRE